MRSKIISLLCSLFAFPLFAATVTISPATTTLATTGVRQFTASVTDAADTTVTWSVNDLPGGNATLGTIDATGRYVAPATPPPRYAVTVKATSNADPSASHSAAVTVRWQTPSISSVSPSPIAPGPFTLTVTGQRFAVGAVVQWNGAPLATTFVSATSLTATGSATQLGANTVRVVNPGPSSISSSFTANVVSSLVVSVSPPAPTVNVGQTLQLSATVANSASQNVTWTATAGTIDASGLYTAPATMPLSGYATITAVAAADGVTSGKTTVTFADPDAVHYARFLEQATFGPTPQSMARVRELGFEAWLDEQFAKPESPWPATTNRDHVITAFFGNALSGDDQLRQRVIYALSEIIVISRNKNTNASELLPWLQILSRNAFGNYRTLLGEITLDAGMGHYLDMVNSARPGLAGGANENYPREVMQLFSVGLYELNPDGSWKLDGDGQPIPTYTQEDVRQLALAFTGWTYNNAGNAPEASGQRGSYWPGPMVPAPYYHDTGAKTVLGQTIPAGQTPLQDVQAALDILFQHPNVGPFLATRLIRALVTSNPSPQYIQRVAAKFDDDGHGVRGDLAAVVRAILLDPEARNDDPPPDFGRLRTPVQHTIGMARALGLTLPAAANFDWLLATMGESIVNAPSVFGHYSPTFRIPNSGLHGPEFQIYSPAEAVNRANFLHSFWSASGGNLPAAFHAANQQLAAGIDLHPLLKQAQSSIVWNRPFPTTNLGRQLGDIARIISLHSQLGVGRQVFFASLGGFDTHSTQSWTQGVLLQEVDHAVRAFYDATEQLGLAQSVTTFTLSDFGRTLQPSGSGSDHGWGNHHVVVGGAVQGARIYGQFPLMTNYANLNATAEDYADARGVLLPKQSLSQYGATLARWFGADPNATFGNLGNFGSATDLGFLA